MLGKLTQFLAAIFVFVNTAFFVGCQDENPSGSTTLDHYVGVTYSNWFPPLDDIEKWGTPLLGKYLSTDRAVIDQHAEWLVEYGADFIVLDWTNNTDYVKGTTDDYAMYIEQATGVLFDVFAQRVEEGKPIPKIAIASGVNGSDKGYSFVDGRIERKVEQIWEDYYGNEKYKDLIFYYEGKPLMLMYLATSACAAKDGEKIYKDDRLTIRFFTGYLGQQENLVVPGTRISKYGYWSWWERGNNVYAVKDDGRVECVTISAAWVGTCPDQETALENPNAAWLPENGAVGRRNGDTFREQWDLAIQLNAEIVLVQSFNEWSTETLPGKAAEELTSEYSNDIEPSEEFGFLYMEIMREKAAILKGGEK